MSITTPYFGALGIRGLTLAQIIENLETRIEQHSELGPEVSTGAHTIVGMILGAVAPEIESVYRLADDIYASGDAAQAEGVLQDALVSLRGIIRNAARASSVTLTLSGTPTTPISRGAVVAIPNGGARWATLQDAEIGGGGTVDVSAECTETGPVQAAPGAISEIITGVSGWSAVTNATSAILGAYVESAADLRIRASRAVLGTTTEEAIWSRLSDLDDVISATVTSNRSDVVDPRGIPPHAYWIVVHPDTIDPLLITETVWGDGGATAGIGFHGAQSGVVTADDGETKLMRWDWAIPAQIYTFVEVHTDGDYPADGDDLIKAAVVTYGESLRPGDGVYPAQIKRQILIDVPGISFIGVAIKSGSPPAPTDIYPLPGTLPYYGAMEPGAGIVIDRYPTP